MIDFFVYMFECSDRSFYVGHTDGLEKRLSEHNSGKIDDYTASRIALSSCLSPTIFNAR